MPKPVTPARRNPETGQPDPRPDLFADFMGRIKAESDAVLNVSTGGGLGMTREERLRAAVAIGLEVATPAQARERLALKGADRVSV